MGTYNKARIGDDSNNNCIMQNVTAENIVMINNSETILSLLAEKQQYDAIQTIVESMMLNLEKVHPLYPTFSAKYNARLNKLVSTPKTKDALENYPKIIKGKFSINYNKYPNMDKRENPWDYAYRTQERIELATTEYKEYLGENEDPFPVVNYEEGMITCIMPPEFPEAVDAILVSGTETIPIRLRRKPCIEYGVIKLGNVSQGHSFDFDILIREGESGVKIQITKLDDCDLDTQLCREKFIKAICDTRNIQVLVNGKRALNANLDNEDELSADMFRMASPLVEYLKSLLIIQKYTDCEFSKNITLLTREEYETAILIAKSLENKWFIKSMEFDNIVRCDYDKISADVLEQSDSHLCANIDIIDCIQLQGVNFSANKYKVIYVDALINNIKKVKKGVLKKRKRILITICPSEGKNVFYRYSMIEGVKVIN